MPETLRGIGLMSGSSLDGLDVAHCSFTKGEDQQLSGALIRGRTIPFPEDWANPKPYADPRNRPKYGDGQVEAVWEAAADADGRVWDQNTIKPLDKLL